MPRLISTVILLLLVTTAVYGQNESDNPATGSVANQCTGAYHLDGVSQHLAFVSPYNPGTGDLSIEGWVKIESFDFYETPVFDQEQDGPTGRPNVKIIILSDGRILFHTARPGSSASDDQTIYSNSSVPINAWTYYACTRENGLYRIYINGQLDAEVDYGVNFDVNGISSIGYVGRRYNTTYSGAQYYLHGCVDEMRVSNVARSESEISDYYASGGEMAVDVNTILLWHMNGDAGSSQKVQNATGNVIYELSEFNNPEASCGFNESGANDQWPTFAHDYSRTSRSEITLGDISLLMRDWYYNPGNSSLIMFASPVIANDIVYISYESGLYALDLQSGTPIWTTASHPDYSGMTFSTDRSGPTVDLEYNRIYFGRGDVSNTFLCADATTGDIIWHRNGDLPGSGGDNRFAHSVIIGNDIFFGDDIGQIYCLDKHTGADKYHTQLDGNIYISPSYGRVDTGGAAIDMLFWSTDNPMTEDKIYGIEPTATGFNQIWQYQNPDWSLYTRFYACPTFYDGNLLVHAYAESQRNDGYSGYRLNLNPIDGSEIDSDYRIGYALYSPPAIFSGVAYYATWFNSLQLPGNGVTAVDIATNSILWNHGGGDSEIDNVQTPASLSSDPYLFFGTEDGKWKILDANTGDLKIQYRLGDARVYSTALAHGSDGKDYMVVSAEFIPDTPHGAVYAFSTDDNTPRPRLHVPSTVIRTSGTLTPPVYRTFPDVLINTGTDVLNYTATLVNVGAGKSGSTDIGISRNDKMAVQVDSPAIINDPEDIAVVSGGDVDFQLAADKTPPGWVSWVEPSSSSETISGSLAPGESVSFTFELDSDSLVHMENVFHVEISSNDPDYTPWTYSQGVQETIEFIDARPRYDSIETACTKLQAGRLGDYGNKGNAPGYALDYSLTGDCDPEANVYIYTGSPVVCYKNADQEIIASHSLFSEASVYPVFDKSLSVATVTTDDFDRYESGTFVSLDSALAMENTWWAPKVAGSCGFVIKRLRLYSYDGASHDGLRIGEAIDWDIPTDYGNVYNTGGYDESHRLIYQRGMETNSAGCQPNDARSGGMAFLGFYVNDCGAIDTTTPPYGAYVADNETYTYPSYPDNFVPREIDSLMQIPGYNLFATELDLHSVMTFFNDYSLAAGDTLNIFIALASTQGITSYSLAENIDWAMSWFNDYIVAECNAVQICGDANGDAAVNIGDAVHLINYIFKGGPAPEPLCVGDGNGDDAINIGDAVHLINYIFKGGPAPVEPCCP